MKTPHEILRNSNPFSVEVKERQSEYVVSFDDAIEAMKLYATEQVKNALKVVQQHAKVKAVKGERIEVMKMVNPHFDGWEVSVDTETIVSLESELVNNIINEI